MTGTGASATVKYIHGDHLGSANVVTNASAIQEELMDYYPFGSMRIDQKTGNGSAQRKYIGEVYDADTGLSYLNARYYDGNIGRFISQDAVFLNPESEGKEIFTQFLSNPQTQNSYSYAINNPITLKDDTGKFTGLEMNPWTAALLVLFMPIETSYDPVYETEQYKAQNNPTNRSLDMAITSTMPLGGKGNVAKGIIKVGDTVSGLKVTKHAADGFVDRSMRSSQVGTALKQGEKYLDTKTNNMLHVVGERGKGGYTIVTDKAQKTLVSVENFVRNLTSKSSITRFKKLNKK